jgi:hypothetical protein
MRRVLRALLYGVFYDIKRLATRRRREQTDSRSLEVKYVPAFDPTIPTGTAEYAPRNGKGRFQSRRR